MGAHDTQFLRRRPVSIDQDAVADDVALPLKRTDQDGPRFIRARDTNHIDPRPERGKVAGNIRSPTRDVAFRTTLHDGNGRFRAEPRDISMNVAIEHEIADNGDRAFIKVGQSKVSQCRLIERRRRLRLKGSRQFHVYPRPYCPFSRVWVSRLLCKMLSIGHVK